MSEWISVKDRLPDNHGYYLCHYIFDTKRCYHDFWFTGSVFSTVDEITHWMPLPNPPKDKE
jgi:hypothetical protein